MTVSERIEQLLLSTEMACVVALSIVLGNMRVVQLPAGGSVSLAAAPLVMFAVVRGVRAGVLCGALAGIGHLLVGGTVIHPIQALLDYPVSYALLGLAGLASSARVGAMLALLAQLAATTTSGAVFFATVAGVEHAWRYSLGYNAATQIPELVLVLLLVPHLVGALRRIDALHASPQPTSVQPLADAPPSTGSPVVVPTTSHAPSSGPVLRPAFTLPSLVQTMQPEQARTRG